MRLSGVSCFPVLGSQVPTLPAPWAFLFPPQPQRDVPRLAKATLHTSGEKSDSQTLRDRGWYSRPPPASHRDHKGQEHLSYAQLTPRTFPVFTEDRVYPAGDFCRSASSSASRPLLHFLCLCPHLQYGHDSRLPPTLASAAVGLGETLSSYAGILPFLPHLHGGPRLSVLV